MKAAAAATLLSLIFAISQVQTDQYMPGVSSGMALGLVAPIGDIVWSLFMTAFLMCTFYLGT